MRVEANSRINTQIKLKISQLWVKVKEIMKVI